MSNQQEYLSKDFDKLQDQLTKAQATCERLERDVEIWRRRAVERESWWNEEEVKFAKAEDTIELLRAALEEITKACEAEYDTDGADDESVGWNGDGSEMKFTYGIIHRARAALAHGRGE